MGEDDGAAALAADIAARTDAYFNRTRAIVQRFGDKRVTYAVFLRRPGHLRAAADAGLARRRRRRARHARSTST